MSHITHTPRPIGQWNLCCFFLLYGFGRLVHKETHFGTSCKRCCALNANITCLSARKCRCHSLCQQEALLPWADSRKLLFGESFYILFIPLDAEVVCKSWSMSPKYAEKKSRILMALNTSSSLFYLCLHLRIAVSISYTNGKLNMEAKRQ